MTQLVHLGTLIQVQFALVDDDGNAIPQQPIQAQTGIFAEAEFTQAFHRIAEQRDQAVEAYEASVVTIET